MHTAETQKRFVELRSQGWSFLRIAAEIGVAKSTLVEWSRKFRFELNNLRALELDELHHRLLGTHEARLSTLAAQLASVEAELAKRDISQLPTSRLFALADSLRRQLARETGAARFVSPVKSIPTDELVDQVQEWKP